MEIFFDGKNQICGGHITNYLIEKIRVVKQAREPRLHAIPIFTVPAQSPGERNYREFPFAKCDLGSISTQTFSTS